MTRRFAKQLRSEAIKAIMVTRREKKTSYNGQLITALDRINKLASKAGIFFDIGRQKN